MASAHLCKSMSASAAEDSSKALRPAFSLPLSDHTACVCRPFARDEGSTVVKNTGAKGLVGSKTQLDLGPFAEPLCASISPSSSSSG